MPSNIPFGGPVIVLRRTTPWELTTLPSLTITYRLMAKFISTEAVRHRRSQCDMPRRRAISSDLNPCRVLACDAMPSCIMPCHAMPCRAVPCRAVPCRAVPCHAITCHAMPCHAMPCHAMPCHAMPCHVKLYCSATQCHAMPCHAMLCYAVLCCAVLCRAMLLYTMPCYAMPCHAVMRCNAMPCHAMLCYALLVQSVHRTSFVPCCARFRLCGIALCDVSVPSYGYLHHARRWLATLASLRGNHLSSTTCLSHVFFRSGEECSKSL